MTQGSLEAVRHIPTYYRWRQNHRRYPHLPSLDVFRAALLRKLES